MNNQALYDKEKINGKSFYYSFHFGLQKIMDNQKELNKMNVFPVPDADTGTNLVSTVRSIIENSEPAFSLQKTASAMAGAALEGARGNSGVILAQYLYGISAEIGGQNDPDIHIFSSALKNAVRYMYEAIANPVEGTMISVIREWAEFVGNYKNKEEGILKILIDSYDIALKSLENTAAQLEILRKNRVVDAGAKGFVLLLEGIIDFFKNRNFKRISKVLPQITESIVFDSITKEVLNYRYCTETIIVGKNLEKEKLKLVLSDMGDSIVIAGSGQKLRVHIHTNNPTDVIHKLQTYGTLSRHKADDMLKQYEAAHQRKWNIALVTDSTCDLPKELMDYYQINYIPLNIIFGQNQYLDRLTITPDLFYSMLDESVDFPTTSQPSETVMKTLYSFIFTHYQSVISLHLTGHFSGTFNTSRKAALEIGNMMNKKAAVFDSRHLSGSLGLIVLRTAEAIEKGMTFEEITSNIDGWCKKARILVGVKTLKYMVRCGRVSPMRGFIANLLNLKPIISISDEGKSVIIGKAFSRKGLLRKIKRLVAGYFENDEIRDYCIIHAHNPEEAKKYAGEIEAVTGKKPRYIEDISPVIGLNAGVGTVAVSLMLE